MNTDELIEARVAARIKGEAKGLAGDKLEQYVKTAVRNRFRNKLRDSQAYSQSNFERQMASFEGLAESGHGVDRSDGGLGVRRMVSEIDRSEREARQLAIVNAMAAKLPRSKRCAGGMRRPFPTARGASTSLSRRSRPSGRAPDGLRGPRTGKTGAKDGKGPFHRFACLT